MKRENAATLIQVNVQMYIHVYTYVRMCGYQTCCVDMHGIHIHYISIII